MEERRLEGKIALVTGAGAGIGRVVAQTFARAGAIALLVDRNDEGLRETEELMKQEGLAADSYAADISRPDEIVRLYRAVSRRHGGRLDILVNNAGFGVWKSPYDLTLEEWDGVVNTNLRGTFLCSREAAKLMRGSGGGSIVNIASTRALMSEPHSEAYAASKGGILSLTHAMAVSLGPDRITVNAICPGWIETGDYSRLRAIDHAQHPAGRVGTPMDIARACLYLTDPRNDFVTGAELVVDGGMTRRMIYAE